MSGDILHELPGTYAAWESPKGQRSPRFTIIERGAGRRGTGRRRVTAETLEEAEKLTASLVPSTTAEILAHITPHNDLDSRRLSKLLALGIPGARLWIICGNGTGYEAVSEGLAVSGVEALFGDDDLSCWLIRWRAADGTEDKGLCAVALEDAERAWWILSGDGRVVAGGPPIFDHGRALEIAAARGGEAVRGTGRLATLGR